MKISAIRRIRVVFLVLGLLVVVTSACTSADGAGDSAETRIITGPVAEQTLPAALKPAPAGDSDPDPANAIVGIDDTDEMVDTAESNLPVVVSDKDPVLPVTPDAVSTSAVPVDSVPIEQDSDAELPEPSSGDTIMTLVPTRPAATAVIPSPSPAVVSTNTPVPTPSATTQNVESPATATIDMATATAVLMATATKQPTAEATSPPPVGNTDLHYIDCSTRTGNNATIAITTDTTINGGFVLEAGDEVAIFTADGSVCTGISTWTGQNIALTAWGDDSQTDALDGLSSGEEMQFRIWDASEMTEYLVIDLVFSVGDGLYLADSIHVVSALTIEKP